MLGAPETEYRYQGVYKSVSAPALVRRYCSLVVILKGVTDEFQD